MYQQPFSVCNQKNLVPFATQHVKKGTEFDWLPTIKSRVLTRLV